MSKAVPEGWEVIPFDAVFTEVKNGCSFDQNGSCDGLPVTRIETISSGKIDYSKTGWLYTTQDIERFKIKKGDILFSHINSLKHIGKTAIKDDDRTLYHGMNLLRFRLDQSKFSPTYLQNLLSWEVVREDMRSKAKQAINQASLNVQDIKTTAYPIPPLPEQQKIAAILSSVDDVIEKTRAQIDKLRDVKTGLMQELLTKGIGHTEFKPLPHWQVGRIAEMQSIPANWELVDILSVAKLESGHTPSRDNGMYWGGDIQWLSLHDTKNLINPIINTTVYSVTQEGIDNSSARILPKDTVALSRTASVGNCVMLGQDMATSQDFANYICGEELNPKYLLQLFRWMQHVWANLSEGSTHKTVYMPVFKKLQILLPPYAEQTKIADAAEKADAAIAAKVEKLAAVMNLKKALMQDLLTGTVRVEAEKEALSHVK